MNDRKSDRSVVIVCETCRWGEDERVRDGISAGEAFAAEVERAAAEAGLETRRHPCLMNCGRHCSAAVVADGKTSYVLGDFEPTADAAAALIDYAALHDQSDAGVVAYRSWPAGVKGKFVARIPPLAAADTT